MLLCVQEAGEESNHTSKNHPKGWKQKIYYCTHMKHHLAGGEKKIWKYEENCPNKTMINQLNLRGLKWTLPMTWECFSRWKENFSLLYFFLIYGLGFNNMQTNFSLELFPVATWTNARWITVTAENDKYKSVWASNIINSLTYFPSLLEVLFSAFFVQLHCNQNGKIMEITEQIDENKIA